MATSVGTAQTITDLLVEQGLVDDLASLRLQPLGGGVSSDIWLVETPARTFVVKRPLAELRVADVWLAPLTRSRSEAGWLEVAGALVPGSCPEVLAYDDGHHFLALEYLPPADHGLWKADLLAGVVDLDVAAAVGERLGALHSLTSRQPDLATRFATDDLFTTLRIEPYLLRLLDHHPELADPLRHLVAVTFGHKQVLVHGDVSPKNILVGPRGPVLLDAETAWWGEPAFDLTFCINHLLLKTLPPSAPVGSLVAASEALLSAYLQHVTWEEPHDLLVRAAALLPALMLARVDGRSPVEYLDDQERTLVRRFAMPRIISPCVDLQAVISEWKVACS